MQKSFTPNDYYTTKQIQFLILLGARQVRKLSLLELHYLNVSSDMFLIVSFLLHLHFHKIKNLANNRAIFKFIVLKNLQILSQTDPTGEISCLFYFEN